MLFHNIVVVVVDVVCNAVVNVVVVVHRNVVVDDAV